MEVANNSELETTATSSVVPGNDDVLEAMSTFFGFPKEEIERHTRKQDVVQARHMIMFILREYGEMSFPSIGRLVGKRDHTTVIHAYNKTKGEVSKHPKLLDSLKWPIELATALKDRRLAVERELKEMNAQLYAEAMANIQSANANVLSRVRVPEVTVIADRDLKVLDMYREGLTLGNIASVFNLSRERVRQVVISTVRRQAINESITKGIVMDIDIMLEEENRKRKSSQEAKKPVKVKPVKIERWSTYYDACKKCNSTAYPHVRRGLCEKCLGAYRGDIREKIIEAHSSKCDKCSMSRSEAIRTYGRDLYIKKDKTVLCKKDFLEDTSQRMGHYKNYEWSRFYEACKKCGTTEAPHVARGLCENCTDVLTDKKRESIITNNGSKCSHCGMSRAEAKSKYGSDLRVTKTKETLCFDCFQKYLWQKSPLNTHRN